MQSNLVVGDGSLERLERELSTLVRLVPVVRQVTATYDLRLEQPTYTLLGWLHDHGPCRTSALATGFHLDASTVSRQTAAAARAGYVVREPDPEDGRAHRLRITPLGREALLADRRQRRHLLRELLAQWSPDDRARYADLTARLNADVHAQVVVTLTDMHRQKAQILS